LWRCLAFDAARSAGVCALLDGEREDHLQDVQRHVDRRGRERLDALAGGVAVGAVVGQRASAGVGLGDLVRAVGVDGLDGDVG
jgi:hypothetical protein